MRVVIDTNILVAAGRSIRGASNKLISLLPDNRFTPAISPALYLEYLAVLLRPEHLTESGRTAVEVISFVRELLSYSHRQRIFFLWRPMLRDPDDDFLLELAIASSSRFIITFNKRDFAGSEAFGIATIWPSEFLDLINEK